MKNRISVIIPTYNRSRLIRKAVESALNAISAGDEIIVVDDGSTDDTEDVLRPLCDRIKYFQKKNSGVGAARNMGIHLATCPLVAFLDDDDEWLPDKLYLQRAVMDAFPHVLFCFTDFSARRANGETVPKVLTIWKNDPWVSYENGDSNWEEILAPGIPFSSIARLPGNRMDFNVYIGDIYKTLMEVQYISSITIMVRKEIAGKSLKFAEDQSICEDWECFARLAKEGPTAYLDCETAIQNVHPEMRLTDVGDFGQATARIKLLHRVWGADESFMKLYSPRFQSVLAAQHLRRARFLIKEHRRREAKEELRTIGGGPWSYRVLAKLPSSVVSAIVSMRRKIIEIKSSH